MAKTILCIVSGSLPFSRRPLLFASLALVALACGTSDDGGAAAPSVSAGGSTSVPDGDTGVARDATSAGMPPVAVPSAPPASGNAETDGGDPACVGNTPGQPSSCALYASTGVPFATEVHPFTDGVSNARLRNPEPGKLCIQGTMVEGGTAAISIVVTKIESDGPPYAIVPLDLQALDITELEFTITKAPTGGVSLELLRVLKPECSSDFDCVGPPLSLGGQNAKVFENGTGHAKMSDFGLADPGPGLVWTFHFSGHSISRANYDFCLEDVKFRDSRGELVTPPPG